MRDHYVRIPSLRHLASPLASVVLTFVPRDALVTAESILAAAKHFIETHPGERQELLGSVPQEQIRSLVELALDSLVAGGFVSRIPGRELLMFI